MYEYVLATRIEHACIFEVTSCCSALDQVLPTVLADIVLQYACASSNQNKLAILMRQRQWVIYDPVTSHLSMADTRLATRVYEPVAEPPRMHILGMKPNLYFFGPDTNFYNEDRHIFTESSIVNYHVHYGTALEHIMSCKGKFWAVFQNSFQKRDGSLCTAQSVSISPRTCVAGWRNKDEVPGCAVQPLSATGLPVRAMCADQSHLTCLSRARGYGRTSHAPIQPVGT